jgi:electron transport complex protein RnfG
MAVKSSFKNMVLCLFVICMVCSALLAGVYALTKETIAVADAQRNESAIKEVLPSTAAVIEAESTIQVNGTTYTYNRAFDAEGNTVGCAVNVAPSGFGGPIKMKVGFNADGLVWNIKVLSHAETPGLGAKCTEPAFSEQFHELDPSDEKNLKVKKDGGNLNAITASTITSRAYANGLAVAVNVFNTIVGTPMHLDSLTGATVAEETK